MNYQTLYDEISNDPEGLGYAGLSDSQQADILNTRNITADDPMAFATEREIAFAVAESTGNPADGNTLLEKLEMAAQGNAVIARNLGWVKPSEGGLPIGHPLTKATIQQLQIDGVVTESERDIMLSLGTKTISRAEQLGLGRVTFRDVQRAKGRFA